MPAPNKNPNDNYAIARIDLPGAGTHGWQVRMQRRGVKYGKFFADTTHGNSNIALVNARNWRDAMLENIADRARIYERSPRNRSGVVGVSKIKVVSSTGTSYEFWQATWSPAPGERCCIKFSIKRHGNKAAFELAVEARNEGIRNR